MQYQGICEVKKEFAWEKFENEIPILCNLTYAYFDSEYCNLKKPEIQPCMNAA